MLFELTILVPVHSVEGTGDEGAVVAADHVERVLALSHGVPPRPSWEGVGCKNSGLQVHGKNQGIAKKLNKWCRKYPKVVVWSQDGLFGTPYRCGVSKFLPDFV